MTFSNLKKEVNKILNSKVKIRTNTYKGKGRPRKSDFVLLKQRDIQDHLCIERLKAGCEPMYIPVGSKIAEVK